MPIFAPKINAIPPQVPIYTEDGDIPWNEWREELMTAIQGARLSQGEARMLLLRSLGRKERKWVIIQKYPRDMSFEELLDNIAITYGRQRREKEGCPKASIKRERFFAI